MKKLYFAAIVFALLLSGFKGDTSEKVNNIILLIGDGMGITHIHAGMLANGGPLQMERAQAAGFIKTSSATHLITDSGAGGTAIATGEKTYNKAISVDTDTVPLKTFLEIAEENNYATGLLSTSSITHATPASFIAHQYSRYKYEKIAADFLKTEIDIFIGGGRDHFEKRKDKRNLSTLLAEKNYQVTYNIKDIDLSKNQHIACLVADEHPPSMIDNRGDYFPEALSISLQHLAKNEKGFFIMAEASQIDWGGHKRDIDYVISEVLDFDKAVGIAFDFADKNPGTLVIVTSDHETGGLTITDGELNSTEFSTKFSTKDHSAVMVPVLAYGTNASLFSGIYENTEIFHKMKEAFNIKE